PALPRSRPLLRRPRRSLLNSGGGRVLISAVDVARMERKRSSCSPDGAQRNPGQAVPDYGCAPSGLRAKFKPATPPDLQSVRILEWRNVLLGLCGRNRHRLPASASGGLVWVVEDKPGGEFIDSIIHFRAEEEKHRLWIDEEAHAFLVDNLVTRIDSLGIFHRIGHACAAAVLNTDADAGNRLL